MLSYFVFYFYVIHYTCTLCTCISCVESIIMSVCDKYISFSICPNYANLSALTAPWMIKIFSNIVKIFSSRPSFHVLTACALPCRSGLGGRLMCAYKSARLPLRASVVHHSVTVEGMIYRLDNIDNIQYLHHIIYFQIYNPRPPRWCQQR